MKHTSLTKTLALAFFCCSFVLLPQAIALAGNAHPCPFLEIYLFDVVPPPPSDDYVCYHPWLYYPPGGPADVVCFSPKVPNLYACLPVHVGCIDNPVCPSVGPECEQYGGFTGFAFGILATGSPVTFISFTPCPGFVESPSEAGVPAAINVSSTWGCRISSHHVGYLTYLNGTVLGATYFDIVPNADLGHFKVTNCSGAYDEGTTVAGSAQWGGTKSIDCWQYWWWTVVESTTWGKIKSLFR